MKAVDVHRLVAQLAIPQLWKEAHELSERNGMASKIINRRYAFEHSDVWSCVDRDCAEILLQSEIRTLHGRLVPIDGTSLIVEVLAYRQKFELLISRQVGLVEIGVAIEVVPQGPFLSDASL